MRREVQKSRRDGKKISAQEIFSRNTKIAGFIILLIINLASAGEIYGKIYRWDTFEPVDAIVEIRNGLTQRMVAENGSYSFTVEDGNYVIIAKWKDLIAMENVTVKGKVRFDLVLIPIIDEKREERDFKVYLTILITLSILIFLYYLKKRERKVEKEEILPEDLNLVLEVIKKEGGRITQKELRKKLGYSEAKMSLIIADLERRGLIEKVKKGRGNIIFLKK